MIWHSNSNYLPLMVEHNRINEDEGLTKGMHKFLTWAAIQAEPFPSHAARWALSLFQKARTFGFIEERGRLKYAITEKGINAFAKGYVSRSFEMDRFPWNWQPVYGRLDAVA